MKDEHGNTSVLSQKRCFFMSSSNCELMHIPRKQSMNRINISKGSNLFLILRLKCEKASTLISHGATALAGLWVFNDGCQLFSVCHHWQGETFSVMPTFCYPQKKKKTPVSLATHYHSLGKYTQARCTSISVNGIAAFLDMRTQEMIIKGSFFGTRASCVVCFSESCDPHSGTYKL